MPTRWRGRARNIDVWRQEAETQRPRRHPGDRFGLRHRHQGLWLHAARGSRIRWPGQRRSRRWRRTSREYLGGIELLSEQPARRHQGRLSRRLFAAARTENHTGSERIAFQNGFVVKDVPESHLCCGSAGTYNILQPDIANRLRDRKVANIAKVEPDMIAAGNIGCMVQIAGGDVSSCGAYDRASRLGDRRPSGLGTELIIWRRRQRRSHGVR